PSCVEAAVDPDGLSVHSDFGQDARITEVLGAIKAETATDAVALYGRSGAKIDWSQFKPRGHYTKSPALGRYFRTMMWLGRVDVGFHLAAPDAAFGRFDAARELRDAALLAWVVRRARQTERLAAMDRLIGFLVG